MAENGRSRVYLGIHFDFDDLVGQEVGQAVADSVAEDFSELELGDAPDRRPHQRQPLGNGDVVNQISPHLPGNQRNDTVRRNANGESQFLSQQTPPRPMIRIEDPAIAVDLQEDDRQRRGPGRPDSQGGLNSNLVDVIYRNDSDFLS